MKVKKVLLTIFVLACFAIYSFHQRGDDSGAKVGPVSQPASQAPTTASGSTGTTTGSTPTATYKDGHYTGSSADAFYGFVQVMATISGGKLTDVQFLQYPNDRSTSVEINSQAIPELKQEALQAQSARVNIISGATDTSQAFIQSLSSALSQAGG